MKNASISRGFLSQKLVSMYLISLLHLNFELAYFTFVARLLLPYSRTPIKTGNQLEGSRHILIQRLHY